MMATIIGAATILSLPVALITLYFGAYQVACTQGILRGFPNSDSMRGLMGCTEVPEAVPSGRAPQAPSASTPRTVLDPEPPIQTPVHPRPRLPSGPERRASVPLGEERGPTFWFKERLRADIGSRASEFLRDNPDLNADTLCPRPGENLLRVAGVTASSEYRRRRSDGVVEAHSASEAFDCNLRTAWAEDVAEGSEQGQYLDAQFAPAIAVDRIVMATGFSATSSKHGDLFAKNLHLKSLQVLVNGTPVASEPFRVERGQRWFEVQISKKDVETVRLEFLETYPSTEWSDLHVSEVLFFGPTSGKSDCATCEGLAR